MTDSLLYSKILWTDQKDMKFGGVCMCVRVYESNPIIIPRNLYIKILLFTQFEI